MVGNGNGINTDITEDTIKPDENKAFFTSFYTMWQLFGHCRMNTIYIKNK
jgi:hypothetical protein